MSKWRWDRLWFSASLILLGAVAGGGVGLIPFWAGEPDQGDMNVYYAVLGGALFFAFVCLLAGISTKSERDDSVQAIREDLDKILESYRPGDPL